MSYQIAIKKHGKYLASFEVTLPTRPITFKWSATVAGAQKFHPHRHKQSIQTLVLNSGGRAVKVLSTVEVKP